MHRGSLPVLHRQVSGISWNALAWLRKDYPVIPDLGSCWTARPRRPPLALRGVLHAGAAMG